MAAASLRQPPTRGVSTAAPECCTELLGSGCWRRPGKGADEGNGCSICHRRWLHPWTPRAQRQTRTRASYCHFARLLPTALPVVQSVPMLQSVRAHALWSMPSALHAHRLMHLHAAPGAGGQRGLQIIPTTAKNMREAQIIDAAASMPLLWKPSGPTRALVACACCPCRLQRLVAEGALSPLACGACIPCASASASSFP
jgi:hypothetical protein